MVSSAEVIGAGSQTVIEGEKHSTGVMNLPADSSATFSIDFDDKVSSIRENKNAYFHFTLTLSALTISKAS